MADSDPVGHIHSEMAATDWELLEDFVQRQSDEAFQQIVGRYADMVMAAALRQVGDAHLAEDVTQAAFIVLARRAASVPARHLPGWLLKTTRFCANVALKKQSRRYRHEKEAAQRRPTVAPPADASALEVSQGLDEAISRLRAKESTAVALRYLQNKPMQEVADAIGVSADAAQKIVSRSLIKLRKILAGKGIRLSSTAALTAMLIHTSARPAAAGFVPSLTAPSGSSLFIAKGAMNMMLWTKIKMAALVTALLLLAGGSGVALVNHVLADDAAQSPASPPAANSLPEIPAPAVAPPAPVDYLADAPDPFLELVGCRIKQTLNLKLGSDAQTPSDIHWTDCQYDQVHWTVDPALSAQIVGYTISVSSADDSTQAVTRHVDKSSDVQSLQNLISKPGDYLVKVSGDGNDGKPMAAAEANVSVDALPFTQIMIYDYQFDGEMNFTNVLQVINNSGSVLSRDGFSDDDTIKVTRMADDAGKPIQFTTTHTNGKIHVIYALNDPVPPGLPLMCANMGTTDALRAGTLRDMGGGEYLYSFSHHPGTNVPVRRIELHILPAGATLVSLDPSELPHQLFDGRIQVFVDKMIAPGGNNSVSIRYRLPDGN
jgi:RNA polymerase sigma factor (sigma-70 family)